MEKKLIVSCICLVLYGTYLCTWSHLILRCPGLRECRDHLRLTEDASNYKHFKFHDGLSVASSGARMELL